MPNDDPDGDGVPFVFDLRFPGQYFDRELNTHYNVFRDYDPGIGRYIQSDPIGVIGIADQYGIVDTRPLSALPIDTVGLDDETVEALRGITAPGLSYRTDFNLYSYVNGNPLSNVDFYGLFSLSPSFDPSCRISIKDFCKRLANNWRTIVFVILCSFSDKRPPPPPPQPPRPPYSVPGAPPKAPPPPPPKK